jgi:hypothetical protein
VHAEVIALGEHAELEPVAVLAEARLGGLAAGEEDHVVGRLALRDHALPLTHLALLEAIGERLEQLLVVDPPQERQLAELPRDHAQRRAHLGETDRAITHLVAAPPVDPIDAARHLHPRHEPREPARGDPLHLRRRLGDRGQVARRLRGQAGLRLRGIVRGHGAIGVGSEGRAADGLAAQSPPRPISTLSSRASASGTSTATE